ncbi:MAG: D-alanine--D-alanine ligase A [Spirochaetae bacterium HGW-Spirochaetae-5]|nr:MAG: D-alanine--D-alanine ligase A [Spirochaetae bacterium HGW-Spirochaetae-5]
MIKVGVLYGGRSGEHDVSRCSAASVIKYLDKSRYEVIAIGIDHDGRWYVQDSPETSEDKNFGTVLKLHKTGNWFVNHYEREGKLFLFDSQSQKEISVDVVFPVVHGTFCEDGTLQGLLELSMVPYVGADVVGSAIGMDKDVAKRLLRDASIPVVDWVTILKSQWDSSKDLLINGIADKTGFPCFIKPCNAGSSVGISKVKNKESLEGAIDEALLWDNKILVEKGVDAREIEFSVIGNDKPEASIPGEIRPRHEFYSYEAKYIDSNGAELLIPAEIDPELTDMMRKAAVEGYSALCCTGMARVDFFLEKSSKKFYLNEINTLPGFTSISMYPKLWEHSGIDYSSLLEKLISLAIERRINKNRLKTGF